jgi:dipeptidyl aminopeptidase/acylaminoacyl peptidase
MNLPPVVSPEDWDNALAKLRAKEKEATRARDALAAERRRMPRMAVDEDYVSIPRSIAFPTENGQSTAYALYYPPSNRDFAGAEGERPPLIVESHGGPTSMTSAQLILATPAVDFPSPLDFRLAS